MATRRREPTWLSRVVIDAIHTDQLREHGGLPGIRDENMLESTLARDTRGATLPCRLIARASESRLARIVSLPVYQDLTIRNWNTTNKLLALMDQRSRA